MDNWELDHKPNKNKVMDDSGSDIDSPEIKVKGMLNNQIYSYMGLDIISNINFIILILNILRKFATTWRINFFLKLNHNKFIGRMLKNSGKKDSK